MENRDLTPQSRAFEGTARLEPLRAPLVRFCRPARIFRSLEDQSRNRYAAAVAIDGDERQIRAARHAPPSGERFFGEDVDLYLERCLPHRRHTRLQNNEVA